MTAAANVPKKSCISQSCWVCSRHIVEFQYVPIMIVQPFSTHIRHSFQKAMWLFKEKNVRRLWEQCQGLHRWLFLWNRHLSELTWRNCRKVSSICQWLFDQNLHFVGYLQALRCQTSATAACQTAARHCPGNKVPGNPIALCFTDLGLSSTAPWIFMNSPTSPRHVARPQGHGGPPANDESHNNIFSRPVSSLQQFHSIWSRRLSSELTQRLEQNWRQKLEERLRVSSCFVVLDPLDLFDPVTGPQWAAFRCHSLKLEQPHQSHLGPQEATKVVTSDLRLFERKKLWRSFKRNHVAILQSWMLLMLPPSTWFSRVKTGFSCEENDWDPDLGKATLVPLKTGGKAPTDAWMHQVRYV